MVQDLDEVPHPLVGLGLLEQPHRRTGLSRQPFPVDKLHRYAGMISVVTTHGCKFHCPYCPIPAYNQYTFRIQEPGSAPRGDRDAGRADRHQRLLRHR